MRSAKIKQLISVKRIFACLALMTLVSFKLTGFLYAQSVTQGYNTSETLQRGMIVSLKEDDATFVLATPYDKMEKMFGVVVNPTDSPITLSGDNERIFVATVGRYDVMVSDEQGTINEADYVTVSSINGVGMKSGLAQPTILGRAVNGFDGKNKVIGTSKLTDNKGGEREVHIGRILVDIAISKNPEAKSDSATPQILSKIGQAIAGKTVSPARIYIAIAILLIGSFTAASIMYAGVRNGMIAIGRNPLSKKGILRGMLQVILVSIIIFVLSLGGVYLLLKL